MECYKLATILGTGYKWVKHIVLAFMELAFHYEETKLTNQVNKKRVSDGGKINKSK